MNGRERCWHWHADGKKCHAIAKHRSATGSYYCDDHRTDSCVPIADYSPPDESSLLAVCESIIVGWAIHHHESYRPEWLAALMPGLRAAVAAEKR